MENKNLEKIASELFSRHCSPLDSGDFGSGVQNWMSEEDLYRALKEYNSTLPYNPLLNNPFINIDDKPNNLKDIIGKFPDL